MTIEVYKELSKTTPVLIILRKEILTQVTKLVLLHLLDKIMNTLNLISDFSRERSRHVLKFRKLVYRILIDFIVCHIRIKDFVVFLIILVNLRLSITLRNLFYLSTVLL